jgi:hypothetical protein
MAKKKDNAKKCGLTLDRGGALPEVRHAKARGPRQQAETRGGRGREVGRRRAPPADPQEAASARSSKEGGSEGAGAV